MGENVKPHTIDNDRHQGTGDASMEDWLTGQLTDLKQSGVPSTGPVPLLAPINRDWLPQGGHHAAQPIVLLKRHPDLDFAAQSLPTIKLKRFRPQPGRGLKKEFTSSVTGRNIFAASSLEFDVLRSVDLDPSVDTYIEQPFLVRYFMGGESRKWRPDILIRTASGLRMIEVKYEVEAASEEDKWIALGQGLTAAGFAFSVVTERHVRREPLHHNIRTVWACRHRRPPREVALNVSCAVRQYGEATIDTIRMTYPISLEQICFLICHGILGADLSAGPLDHTMKVTRRGPTKTDPWSPRA